MIVSQRNRLRIHERRDRQTGFATRTCQDPHPAPRPDVFCRYAICHRILGIGCAQPLNKRHGRSDLSTPISFREAAVCSSEILDANGSLKDRSKHFDEQRDRRLRLERSYQLSGAQCQPSSCWYFWYYTLWRGQCLSRVMCRRLRVGKSFLHVLQTLVGAAMCSAGLCGPHDPWP